MNVTDTDAIIGIPVIILALSILMYLVAWSRRIISRISQRNLQSAREIEKDLRNGS